MPWWLVRPSGEAALAADVELDLMLAEGGPFPCGGGR